MRVPCLPRVLRVEIQRETAMRWYDAHNHLQAEELRPYLDVVAPRVTEASIARMVVNGSTEGDWEDVRVLARRFPFVLPSFGLHPWYLRERSTGWRERLVQYLDSVPSAVGEIGLDRWMPEPDLPDQEEVFVWQLELAAARDLPLTIHCLRAWGRLDELLRRHPRPAGGFLLHSYGGPVEMVPGFAALGAYFSISGHFAQDWKRRQRDTFREVPLDRLLIETDAPFMPGPPGWLLEPLPNDTNGRVLNHPVNLVPLYAFVAGLRGLPVETLAAAVETNFTRLFARICGASPGGYEPSTISDV